MPGVLGATPATVFEFCTQELEPLQRHVLSGYFRMFAKRHVFIRPAAAGEHPCLLSNGTPVADRVRHCFWNWGSNAGIDADGTECGWLWHHGPSRELCDATEPRVILLPRNDLFDIRGVDATPEGWAGYRSRIAAPWSEKRDTIYFRGHFTGPPDTTNSRVLACRLIDGMGVPADVGLLDELTPPELRAHVPLREAEPLDAMGRCRYVLSLWGNHPFNARLYRGLEAGSLVFHQATPTIRLLTDDMLQPGRDYVEIAADLSDLEEQVDHFVRHPSDARDIAAAGHRTWMDHLFSAAPYTVSDAVWERFTAQPHWPEFTETFAVR